MTKELLISSEQAATTANYLEKLFNPEAGLPSALMVALSEACLATLHEDQVDHNGMLGRLTRLERVISTSPDPDSLGLDPLILTKLAVALSRTRVGTLPMDGIFARLTEELKQQDEAVLQSGRVRLLSSLLHSVGININVAPPPQEFALAPVSAKQLLQADDDRLLVISDQLGSGGVNIAEDAHEIFGAIMLTILRDYRLDVASRMLRAMLIREIDYPAAMDGLQFLAVQRSCDGMYGFSDPFSDKYPDQNARDFEFRLPVTVNTLWLFSSFIEAKG